MDLNLDQTIELLQKGKHLEETNLILLFNKLMEILYQEGTVHPLELPIIICGDVHGQLYDVFELFRVSGGVESNQYLFLGDYVDRGHFSLETFAYLAALKLKHPSNIYLLRGNHECRQVNQLYGFYDECTNVYGHSGIWRLANELFDLLPIGAIVANKIFGIHGGLSPDIKLIEQIPLIDRQEELPSSGPLADLCWSDPDDISGWKPSSRGAGWFFGPEPTREFCRNNEIDLIVRAHQLAMAGYMYHFTEEQLVTVWSAPNYMYRTGNKASVLKIDSDFKREFVPFDAVPEDENARTNDSITPAYFS